MKNVVAIVWLLAASQWAPGQPAAPIPPASRSASGQFVIHDRRGEVRPARPTTDASRASTKSVVDLEPALLAVACERIKQALYFELRAPSRWQGKVHVTIQRRGANAAPTLVSEHFRDGWNYQLSLPATMERTEFVRTLTQVVLTEFANRGAGDRPAEVPGWLLEGFTQHLLATRNAETILAPPVASIRGVAVDPAVVERRDTGPLEAARQALRDRPPLTLAELSWMTGEQVAAPGGELYRYSAQLFLAELLRLPDGRDCLREMIAALGGCFNWQTAFLRSFREHFANQLAVEKWWTLQVVYFSGRDPRQLWTPSESWQRLDEALRTTVAIRGALTELPAHSEVTLQAVIREWDRVRQATTIRARIADLEAVKLRVAPEFIPITESYRRTLAEYLQRREHPVLPTRDSYFRPPNPLQVARETIRQLDVLDARRTALRPSPGTESKPDTIPVAAQIPGTF
jgi:hypothetical protein